MNFYTLSYKSNDVLLILLKLFHFWPLVYIYFSWFLCLFGIHHQCVCVVWSKSEVKIDHLCLTLCDPMDCRPPQALLSMGLSRQGYWSGLPCPPPGDLYWATREAHVCEREQVNKREWVRVRKQLHYCICPIPALWLRIFQRALFPFIGECFYCILGLLIAMSIIASSPLSRQSKEIYVFIPTHAYTHTYRRFLCVSVWNGTILKLSKSS